MPTKDSNAGLVSALRIIVISITCTLIGAGVLGGIHLNSVQAGQTVKVANIETNLTKHEKTNNTRFDKLEKAIIRIEQSNKDSAEDLKDSFQDLINAVKENKP
jgi:preprotein translocase subunit SecF